MAEDPDNMDEWYLTGSCPQCGGKTSWIPNYVISRENKTFEVGQYHCNKCGAKSGVREYKLEWDAQPSNDKEET